MIRSILGVIAGYAIFVVTAVAFFKLTGHAPHAQATTVFMLATAVYGAVASVLAGFVTRLIAQTKKLGPNYALAAIILAFATFSLFKASGNHWTQLLAIFVFAPVSILGGVFYRQWKSNRK